MPPRSTTAAGTIGCRWCPVGATTLAFLSQDDGPPIELAYTLCGQVQCVDRCRKYRYNLQDVEAAVLARAMPFVSITCAEDVNGKNILHGVFRKETYSQTLRDGKATLFEFEGPAPTQGTLVVVAPDWEPSADLKDEVENVKLWPPSCRPTIQDLLENKRDMKPMARTKGADLPEQAWSALDSPCSRRVVRMTKKGEPHLVHIKLGLFLPILARLLQKDPEDVAKGPDHVVIRGHVELDGGTDERSGLALAGVGAESSGECALAALVAADLGLHGNLMPQKNMYGVCLDGLVATVYSWSGDLANETVVLVRGALLLSRPAVPPAAVRNVFEMTRSILAMRLCARPATVDSRWSLEMLPDYSPPSEAFDAATLQDDYPGLVKALRAPEVEPLLAAEKDHAAAAKVIASASGNSISRRVAKALLQQIVAELPSARKLELLAEKSCAATTAKILAAVKEVQEQRRAAVVAQRRQPLIGGVGARFGKLW